ncbi:MlaD family protein [Primorskyibacter sp. S87]|uniref:MlaD family protein n=1 Tax=Primorskyibacter sp. S87 TaxID=3415126 RepID=UPI003C7B18A2
METRANYILIGAFTLAGLLGMFGALLWFAKVEVSRQYAYFDVLFEDVSGLASAASVRYNGLPVGQVVSLDLDENDPSKVRVRLEVDSETPIKTDTVAQLQSLGVTGVSYVGLSGGSPTADLLPDGSEIQSKRSPLQSIFEGAPELLNKAIDLLEDVQSVVNDENRAAVSQVLENLASASGRLDRTLDDFETLSGDLGSAAREIAAFTDRLDQLSETAETTLNTATDTLTRAQDTADSAIGTLDTAKEAFSTADGLMQNELSEFIARGTEVATTLDETVKTLEPTVVATLESAQDLVTNRLPVLAEQVQETARVLEEQVASVGAEATQLIDRYEQVGETAQKRLEEAESTIALFEETLTDARDTVETINASVQQDLPGLLEDLHRSAETVNRVVGDIGENVSDVAERLRGLSDDGRTALNSATETFANANDTLEAIYSAMESAETTLATADQAFASVNRIVDEDVDAIVTDVRSAVDKFSNTMTRVTGNIDVISEEVLSASRSASDLVGTLDTIVQQNSRQVSGFLRVGLPQLQQFVEESRRLVVNLDRLVKRVERDPARFLLGTQASEFRR